MNQKSLILIDDSCRLCLQQQGKYNVFEMQNLSEDICTWMAVKIKPNDGLPQSICEQCFEIINSIRVLRDLALCNESRLRVFVLNNENEKKDNTFIDGTVAPTVSINIDQNCEKDLLDCVNLSNKIRNSDDRGQQTEDDDQFANLEIIENGIKLEEDDYIETEDNFLSRNDPLQVHPPTSSGITVRKDLFSTSEITNEQWSPNETNQNSVDDKFNSGDAFKKYQVRVEIDEVHKCTICDKVYESKKKWYHHQRTHNKSFSCPIPLCNKKFANRGDVDKHVRVHTGEKPYECEICFKKFTQRCSLKIHKENLHVNQEV